MLQENSEKEASTEETAADASGDTEVDLQMAKSEDLPDGWTKDEDGKLTGEIKLSVYTNKEVSYSEIRDLNAYQIAQKLDIKTDNNEQFVAAEEGGKNYYDLVSLEADGEEIAKDALKAEENKDKTFSYNPDAIKITYYKTDFLYWEKLPDFTKYETVDAIPKQEIYNYSDENTKEKVGKKSLKEADLIDDSYFAIEGTHEVGDIVGQTVPADTEYDQTNPPNDTELKINAIGTILNYKGKTGKQFCEELSNLGFGGQAVEDTNGTSMEQSSSVGNRTIISVKVYKATEDGTSWDTSEELKEFQVDPNNDKNVYFVITVKAPETQAPAPTPSYDGGGSYSAPSSGGSSGGGSSHNPGRGFDN